EPHQYENIVIKSNADGSMLKLKDIADIEFGSLDYAMTSKSDGRPSASIILKQRPGSNAREAMATVKKRVEELKESTFPPGMTYVMSYDASRTFAAAITELVCSLFEACILVTLRFFLL